jgi:discoidin domain receptor family protein 2
MLQGNVNTYTAELRDLEPPIIARALRFVPYSSRPRVVCMRVEVYGCVWQGGWSFRVYNKYSCNCPHMV